MGLCFAEQVRFYRSSLALCSWAGTRQCLPRYYERSYKNGLLLFPLSYREA